MHIIGHTTITLHLKNLRVTHHFIIVESLMTDVILGIDFQREYRISYDWDEEKWCYIRHNGQFLCYTEDMESGINRVSIAKLFGDSDPVSQKPYPVAMKHYNWVKEEIDKLLEAGVIRNSHSSWSAPIIVVPKEDGGKCLVIDYRELNKVTRKFIWPMPKVEDIFSQLNGAKYFSTLDLRAGYHHIGLSTDSIPKTAFTSPFGKYEYVKVPFRLAQAPACFQELMTGVLKDLPFAMAYLDDIIIYSSTPEEHLQHIKTVFEKLCHAKLSMKLSKCHFFTKEIQYLGHILGVEGIRPVPAKLEAIKAMHPPVNPKQVCTFLRLVGYYRKFIKNFAKIVKPLTMLTRMDVKFEWKETHHCAFMKLKDTIIKAPILRYPNTTKPYIMYMDTSDNACRAQLSQMHETIEFLVAFLSHTFTDTQQRWSRQNRKHTASISQSRNGTTTYKEQTL